MSLRWIGRPAWSAKLRAAIAEVTVCKSLNMNVNGVNSGASAC